jgi:predicted ATPase
MEQPFTSLVCPILIGRTRELALVKQFLRGDTRPVLLLVSEAGVGKSRLVAEAVRHAAVRGVRVCRGACFEPDRAVPYAPLLDLLRGLTASSGAAETDPTFQSTFSQLGALLPELSLGQPSSTIVSVEPEQHRRRVSITLSHLQALAMEAGFRSVRRVPLENPFDTLYELKP